jgi:hypothetical protein
LLLFVPDLLNLIVTLSNDFRQCSNPGKGAHPFSQVRIQLFSLTSTLCSTLGPNSGVEFIAQVIVPFVVADFLPPKAGVKLVAAPKSSAKQKNGSRSHAAENLQQKTTDKDSAALANAALTCLAEIFKSCGVFLRKSLHKNVQCILVSIL